ncbi:hypothetical protein TNCV_2567531 [Trichonephila clavipes]|uniref:Uncharacterized protein n=1 Tax=Trichonephila clavipes TaxID=2585209 RepID=A0A8X6WN83_TRICX|nr:hypothetical protein TNCV_2567531 [Trichonephila clavipes]
MVPPNAMLVFDDKITDLEALKPVSARSFTNSGLAIDLNPIEPLGNLIGRDMNRGLRAQTMDDLITTMDVAWQQLPQQPSMD